MLQTSTSAMNGSRTSRGSRSRTATPDRGGIRKRGGAHRIDRDGDLDMDSTTGRGRGGRSRGHAESGRRTPAAGFGRGRDTRSHGADKDKTLVALQKSIFNNASSQANVRPGRGRTDGISTDRISKDRGGLVQLSIRGWTGSKAASNPDGGVESLIAFLEKKATPTDSNTPSHLRLKISKVCATSPFGGRW